MFIEQHWHTTVLHIKYQPLLRVDLKEGVLAIRPFPICHIVSDMVVSEFVSEVDHRDMWKSRRAHWWQDVLALAVCRGDHNRWITKLPLATPGLSNILENILVCRLQK